MASVNRGNRLRSIPIETYNALMRDRIFSKVSVNDDGCWIFEGARLNNGYAGIRYLGSYTTAHRASYLAFIGEIKPGFEVCHKCDVRACVNPWHLFTDSHAANMEDMRIKGRARGRLSYASDVLRDLQGRFIKDKAA